MASRWFGGGGCKLVASSAGIQGSNLSLDLKLRDDTLDVLLVVSNQACKIVDEEQRLGSDRWTILLQHLAEGGVGAVLVRLVNSSGVAVVIPEPRRLNVDPVAVIRPNVGSADVRYIVCSFRRPVRDRA